MEAKSKKITLDMNEWHEIINKWSNSGESQKVYCERLGISLNTFTYVRGKLQKHTNPPIQFAPLTVKKNNEDSALMQSFMVLENTRGYKLSFPASLSLEQLVKIFDLSGWKDA